MGIRVYIIISVLVPLSCAQLPQYFKELAKLEDDVHFDCALNSILKPRVVGSKGHNEVRRFIIDELQSLGLQVELDEFSANTPIFKNLTFTNIIARSNPNADTYLTLACHYDSKYFPDNPNFVGAIDSAVPCAILLNLVKVLQPYLKNNQVKAKTGLMLIFFDGEEAFYEWNDYDSLYGARHLAQKWASQTNRIQNSYQTIRDIDRIEVLVLVDLVGAADSTFYNFYARTQPYHVRLVQIERTLGKANLLNGKKFMFLRKTSFNRIGDDHKPFYEEDVPVLHIIATPFPPQWHTAHDDASNLHGPSIKNFLRIFKIFVYEYLFLNDQKTNLRAIQEVY